MLFRASPAFVARPVAVATTLIQARIPFVKGNLKFADGEGRLDGDPMLGCRCQLGGWRAHSKLTGGYHNHVRTFGAVSEFRDSAGHLPDGWRRRKAILRRQGVKR